MTDPGIVDSSLDDGLRTNAFLTIGAVFGAFGWLLTQYVAWNPGLALDVVGLEGATVLVLFWIGCTLALVGVGVTVAARSVRYSPPLWIWGSLIAIAFVFNAAVVGADVVPRSARPYLLWHPWMVVYAVGYLATGIAATERNRPAYLLGFLGTILVLLVGVSFPRASSSWVFALTGLVHAGPILLDVATSRTSGSGVDDPVAGDRV